MKSLETMSEVELLRTNREIIDVLQRRGVVKTKNNPVGDYTEWLVRRCLGLEDQGNNTKAFDALDPQGLRYQIKGRCSNAPSVQFSSIRNLKEHGFDFVIAVAFDEVYSVRFAFKVSYEAVPKFAKYQALTNGHNLILTPKAVEDDGVEDISHRLN